MANQAILKMYVKPARGSCLITYATSGRYVSLITNTVGNRLVQQPIQPTSSPDAFWESVISLVLADITAGHGG